MFVFHIEKQLHKNKQEQLALANELKSLRDSVESLRDDNNKVLAVVAGLGGDVQDLECQRWV